MCMRILKYVLPAGPKSTSITSSIKTMAGGRETTIRIVQLSGNMQLCLIALAIGKTVN